MANLIQLLTPSINSFFTEGWWTVQDSTLQGWTFKDEIVKAGASGLALEGCVFETNPSKKAASIQCWRFQGSRVRASHAPLKLLLQGWPFNVEANAFVPVP